MYKDKLDEIMYDVNNKAISTKILQHMAKIRNNDDEGQARRFAWELIQNAKDVANEGVPLRIRMTLEDDRLTFAHNGKNFRLKNILSLINQVSGKNDDMETTGKFGTGFVTTHLLSERVTLRGILEDYGLEPKAFEICIDRSGKDDNEIIEAVNSSVNAIRCIDDRDTISYDPSALNTEFEYHLETEYSRKVAHTGMNDACLNLFYVMAFVPQIYEITLDNRTNGTVTVYRRDSARELDGGIRRFIITENDVPHEIIQVYDDSVQIAAEIGKDNEIVPINDKASRLFCSLPLIDSVPFPFPTALNSSSFRVNEPRSCITLTDNPNSTDSVTNKRLMKQAVGLYDKLLRYAENRGCQKLYRLVYTPPVFKRSDISEQWVKDNIINGIAEAVGARKILPGKNGLFAASQSTAYLPDKNSLDLAEELNELFSSAGSSVVTKDTAEWSTALDSVSCRYCRFVGIKDVLGFADALGTVGKLTSALNISAEEWLKKLYLCAVKIPEVKNEIFLGKYKLIPVQSGNLRSITEVFEETAPIDEYFKGVCDDIDGYIAADKALHIREKLISRSLDLTGYENIKPFDIGELESHIKYGTRNDIKFANNFFRRDTMVRNKMAACYPDERAYNISSTLLDLPERYTPEMKLSSDVWNSTYIALESALCSAFSNLARYGNGAEQLFSKFGGREKAIDAINYYYEVKDRFSALEQKDGVVLTVEANGKQGLYVIQRFSKDYCVMDDIDDMMINIYYNIVPNPCKLIDRSVNTGRTMQLSRFSELTAASLVGNTITSELNNGALYTKSKQFQAACTLLMRWINANEEKAKRLFPAFASKEARMQLLTAEQAADMSSQLDAVNELMKKCGITDLSELEKKMNELGKSAAEKEEQDNGIPEEYFELGYSAELGNLEEITQKIGVAGENHAMDILKEKYGENAVITLCNSAYHKQQGYDITVKLPGEDAIYYEVKTHTATSAYRHHLKFSRSQAGMLSRKDYRVLLVIVNGQLGLVGSKEFDNVLDSFDRGRFVRQDGYTVITD